MLPGDFNIDLLKHDHNIESASFLDSLYTNFLLPYISTPSRVKKHSRTLTDNIFSDNIGDAQFLFMKNIKIKQKETTNISVMILKI